MSISKATRRSPRSNRNHGSSRMINEVEINYTAVSAPVSDETGEPQLPLPWQESVGGSTTTTTGVKWWVGVSTTTTGVKWWVYEEGGT